MITFIFCFPPSTLPWTFCYISTSQLHVFFFFFYNPLSLFGSHVHGCGVIHWTMGSLSIPCGSQLSTPRSGVRPRMSLLSLCWKFPWLDLVQVSCSSCEFMGAVMSRRHCTASLLIFHSSHLLFLRARCWFYRTP